MTFQRLGDIWLGFLISSFYKPYFFRLCGWLAPIIARRKTRIDLVGMNPETQEIKVFEGKASYHPKPPKINDPSLNISMQNCVPIHMHAFVMEQENGTSVEWISGKSKTK